MLTCTPGNGEEALPPLNHLSIAVANLQAGILPCNAAIWLKVAEVQADFEVFTDVMSCSVLCKPFCI